MSSPSSSTTTADGRLGGAAILVTGAAGGIGSAACARLTAEGAHVVAVDRDRAALEAVPAADRVAVDLTDAAAADRTLRAAIDRAGRLDGVFSAAGGSGRRVGDGPVDACTAEGWQWTLDVNLTSHFHVCRVAVPPLLAGGGGSIVLLGSVLGVGGGGRSFATHAYAAAKAGLTGLARAMASFYADRGLRVNVLAPGLVATPMSRRAQTDPAIMAEIAERQPLGGIAEPEDVAAAAAFLLSADAARITGTVMPLDGGWLVR